MAPLSPPKNSPESVNFAKRTASAAVGIPLAVGAVLLGSPYVDLLAILLLGVLLWEWSKMSGLPLTHPINAMVAVFMGWAIFGTSAFLPAFCLTLAGLFLIFLYHYQLGAKLIPSLILLSGPFYIGLGMIASLNLAKWMPLTLLWALVVVWATDTGAYVIGSLIGGPKLVPRISPGKTWVGFAGGSLVGSALGVTLAPSCQILPEDKILLLGLTLMVTLVGHTGDIFESAAKRLFNVKDSSRIIPGHGGLLDRLDSLLLVAPFLVILKFFRIF